MFGRSGRASLLVLAFALAESLLPAAAAADNGDCGIPVTTGSVPKTSDCLFVLRAGVGSQSCADCVCDVNDSGSVTAGDALACLKKAVGQDVTLDCPPCPAGGSCPDTAEWTTHASFGAECDSNSDCDIGRCDQQAGRCRTETGLEIGFSGLAHHADLGEGFALRAAVDCDGSGGDCGSCEITGIDTDAGNCRCANDNRQLCDEPFSQDSGCPACFAGAFVSQACADNADCDGGPCAKRCANDSTKTCTKSADCPGSSCGTTSKCDTGKTCFVEADCVGTCTGTAQCNCYDGAPIALSTAAGPFCVLPRYVSDLTGTVDPDTGASLLSKDLALLVYLGEGTLAPCPVCGGHCSGNPLSGCATDDDCTGLETCVTDRTAGDGSRGGQCIGGASDGLPCDVHQYDPSFPVLQSKGGGGGYSLDCLPVSNSNVSGSGLRIPLRETTGTSTLSTGVPCSESDEGTSCFCALCTGDPSVPCAADSDCAGQRGRCAVSNATVCDSNADCTSGACEPSTCSRFNAFAAEPNGCAGGLCVADGDGTGHCDVGPSSTYCEQFVRADGSGVLPCIDNCDCDPFNIGGCSGCTLVEKRPCFPDPLVASGDPDDVDPVSVATFCSGNASSSINSFFGLPGPARLSRATSLRTLCPGSEAEYGAGHGGCP